MTKLAKLIRKPRLFISDALRNCRNRIEQENRRRLAPRDGLIRSIRPEDPSLSHLDRVFGMLPDDRSPVLSRLIDRAAKSMTEATAARARSLIATIVDGRLSHCNHRHDVSSPQRPHLLVVEADPTRRSARRDSLAMLDLARSEFPEHLILVCTDADRRGAAGGTIRASDLTNRPNVQRLPESWHLAPLLETADHVYVETSPIGFEALLRDRAVTCIGTPFYAGRGLTRDLDPSSGKVRASRLAPVSLDTLVHAVMIEATEWRDPATGTTCPAETVLARLADIRRRCAGDPPRAVAYGFSNHKLAPLQHFFPMTEFVTRKAEILADPTLPIIAWGKLLEEGRGRKPAAIPTAPARIIHVEDGFTRSRGLGAAHVTPLSWLSDDVGIHYDAAEPSALEVALASLPFDAQDLARARAYRDRIVSLGVSKYNLAGKGWTRPDGASRVILVPGQVEADASLRYGSPDVRSNRALLEAVRRRNPHAHILYRPHPDIVHGHQPGSPEEDARGLADEIDIGTDILDVLSKVDAVETMTSLTGMEALLRGLPVTCHGLPFYAGWGLTEDLLPTPRRGRLLDLDALVFGAYIAAPRFVSPVTGLLMTAEEALDALAAPATA